MYAVYSIQVVFYSESCAVSSSANLFEKLFSESFAVSSSANLFEKNSHSHMQHLALPTSLRNSLYLEDLEDLHVESQNHQCIWKKLHKNFKRIKNSVSHQRTNFQHLNTILGCWYLVLGPFVIDNQGHWFLVITLLHWTILSQGKTEQLF